MRQPVLGKGLSALLKDGITNIPNTETFQTIDIDKIEAGTYQPRKNFEYDKIKELADSIAENGLLQPIIISKNEEDQKYKIIAGERRWRACKLAGYQEIPVIIKDLTNEKSLEIALIENIQREELSAIEEAEGYLRLIQEFSYTQETLSRKLGKSRSHIANLLRLNQLPQSIKDMISLGKLSMGHARCLIGHEHAETIAEYVIEHDLSVRQAENIVKEWKKEEYSKSPEDTKRRLLNNGFKNHVNELDSLAKSLSERLNIKVTIENYSIGGKLIFHYSDLEQLDSLLTRIS
jgi:ParB family transcriptional regulator, chromosome partitioning protein